MTEHDNPALRPPQVESPPTGTGTGQALTSLLDLHRRGVIDDQQFADLSRNLTGAVFVPGQEAAVDGARAGGQAGRLSRRSAAIVAGAAVLVLAAGGITLAVLPDAGNSDVALASAMGTPPAAAATKPAKPTEPARTNSPAARPSASASAAPAKGAAQSAAPTQLRTVALRPKIRPAVTAAPTLARKAAPAVAPVPVAKAPAPRVNCSAYSFAKEDNRLAYEAAAANRSISFNMALNSGNLDEAARLQSEAQAASERHALDDARLLSLYPGCS